MRHWLDVPYGEKDLAQRCGAWWDPAAKRWYAPRTGMRGLERWAAKPELPELLPGEDRSFGAGLFTDLVPASCWFTNARTCISQQDWERVRRLVTGRAGRRCEACGAAEDRPAQRWLEAHERWQFSAQPNRRQILRRLICLCTDCHTSTHYGLAQIRGVDGQALAHLCDVTGMSQAEAQRHVREAFALWEQRSGFAWDLDLTMLTSAGIVLANAAPSAGTRPQAATAALARTGPPPAPGPRPVTIADRPKKPGSRWQRWITTGER